jgi:hypothetical protein
VKPSLARSIACLGLGASALSAAACGSSDGSKFGPGSLDAGTNNSGVVADAAFNPPTSPAGIVGFEGGTGEGGTFGSATIDFGSGACAAKVASATLATADLVVMFDRSGSMGDVASGWPQSVYDQKWGPVTSAMKAFFTDPSSADLYASLQFFPPTSGGDLNAVCSYDYATPLVPLTSLLYPTPLTSAIDGTKANGGTPTLPALEGAITYAQQVAQSHPLDKTVIVLVTDGDPGFGLPGDAGQQVFAPGCTDNDIPHVAAAAQAADNGTPPIPTYVIGVGSDFTNLDAIASAGGTQHAILVPVANPTQTSTVFQNALNSIRAASVPCLLPIPSPPDGQQINPLAVNVVLETGNSQTVLKYSGDCSDANGWHYDNLANPTLVELCPSSCNTAQGPSQKLGLAFGCNTYGGPTQ